MPLRTLTIADYCTLAAQAGRTIVPQHEAQWQCNNCVGQDPYGRKRHDCPACRGHGMVIAPSPSVERIQAQWGTDRNQRYHNLRQAQWEQMAELIRQGRIRW